MLMRGILGKIMEVVRRYWKRRGYLKLQSSHRLRFDWRRSRLSWPMLNFLKNISRSVSLKKWLVRLRDAYVDMMLGWSSTPAFATGTMADAGISAFGRAPLKEYDQKVIVELYRSLLLARSKG